MESPSPDHRRDEQLRAHTQQVRNGEVTCFVRAARSSTVRNVVSDHRPNFSERIGDNSSPGSRLVLCQRTGSLEIAVAPCRWVTAFFSGESMPQSHERICPQVTTPAGSEPSLALHRDG